MAENGFSVLIVGAGPTGLLLACELARLGVSFRLIDKKLEPTQTSNAAGIQTRTLELFADIGILQPFLNNGVKCRGASMLYQQREIFSLPLDQIDSIYSFILMLPQCETEKFLTTHLQTFQQRIHRGTELVALDEQANGVTVMLRTQNGEQEAIHCDWVVGCDGARSTVRDAVGIAFPGEDIEQQFVVADMHVQGVSQLNRIMAYTTDDAVLAIFPLGENRYRMAANLDVGGNIKTIDAEHVRKLVNERSDLTLQVETVSWASPFWIHSKMANNMRKGRIFLAGDAAHIHSPVGGQGMNTGLQDVYNLAWKLAYVIKGRAKPALLDTYELERQPVIKAVVDTSERATQFLISKNKWLKVIYRMMMRIVNTQRWIKYKMAMRMTQLDICYQNSMLVDHNTTVTKKSPQPGMRAKDVRLTDNRTLHDLFDNRKFNLVLFVNQEANEKLHQGIDTLASQLELDYPGMINMVIIDDVAAYAEYHMTKPAIYFIRPDYYISFCDVISDDINIFIARTRSLCAGIFL